MQHCAILQRILLFLLYLLVKFSLYYLSPDLALWSSLVWSGLVLGLILLLVVCLVISFVLVLFGLLIHVKSDWLTILGASARKDVSVQDSHNMYTFDEDFFQ